MRVVLTNQKRGNILKNNNSQLLDEVEQNIVICPRQIIDLQDKDKAHFVSGIYHQVCVHVEISDSSKK